MNTSETESANVPENIEEAVTAESTEAAVPTENFEQEATSEIPKPTGAPTENYEQAATSEIPKPTAAPAVRVMRAVQPQPDSEDHLKAVEFCRDSYANIQRELAKVVVGQGSVLEEILIAIFTRSHALLVGVPGLAKTLMISTLAQTLQLSFKRVQFTPDLMPSDITGTEVIYSDQTTGEKQFKFLPGPMFANILLADEINRTPPKTQAAMLEAMQERRVTVGGNTYALPKPFFRARHAKSPRAGGNLSAAGSAAGSLHVPDQRRLPDDGG